MKFYLCIFLLAFIVTSFADPSADYFPNDIGNQWIVEDITDGTVDTSIHTVVDTAMMLGYNTFITEITYPSDADTNYFQFRGDGIYSLVTLLDTLGDPQPLRVAPLNIEVGDSWTALDFDTTLNEMGAEIDVFVEIDIDVLAREDVTVPGGTFTDCLKTNMISNFSYDVYFGGSLIASGSGINVRDTTWLARYVGIVKETEIEYEIDFLTGSLSDSTKTCSSLIDYDFTAVDEYIPVPSSQTLNTYPNPFNSSVVIEHREGSEVSIYNIHGDLIEDASVSHGNSSIWEPDETVESGIYLIRSTSSGKSATKRIFYIK